MNAQSVIVKKEELKAIGDFFHADQAARWDAAVI